MTEWRKVSMVIPRILSGISGWYHYLNKVDLQKLKWVLFGTYRIKGDSDIQIRTNRRLNGFIFKSQVKDRGTDLKTLKHIVPGLKIRNGWNFPRRLVKLWSLEIWRTSILGDKNTQSAKITKMDGHGSWGREILRNREWRLQTSNRKRLKGII